MLPTYEIEITFHDAQTWQLEIINEIRSMIAEIAPDAVERIHSKGTSYFHAGRGGPVSAGICQIVLKRDHVRLAFIHGAFLPDPHKLLQGTPKYKKFVPIYSFENTEWDVLKDLITNSSKFDPYTLNLGD